MFTTNTGYFLPVDDLYLLALLNSRLVTFCLENTSATFRGGYLRLFGQYVERLPVRQIHFTTPDGQRSAALTAAKSLYEQGVKDYKSLEDFGNLLEWVEAELAAGRTDTVHDLLAFLAEQMIAMNGEKQALTADFWTDLEGVAADRAVFDRLRNKGKWEQSLHKAVAAARPFVSAESRSTVTLDASLGWNEEAFKGFVRELAGAVRGLSDLVRVYRSYRPRYTELSGRLAATDALIDQVVYRLYGLSEEEVAIVEGKT